MIIINIFLRALALPSYFAVLLFLDFIFHKISAFFKKQYYALDDFRFRFRNLTSNDGSKNQLIVFLCILFITIITSPFFIDLVKIENLYFKPSGTYSYLVQYSYGDTYPAQIKKIDSKFYVEKVFINNDKILEYEDDENEVFIGKQSYVTRVDFSDSDRITLLNKHVVVNSISETNHVSFFYCALLLVLIVSDIFVIIVYHPQKPFGPKEYLDEYLDQFNNSNQKSD